MSTWAVPSQWKNPMCVATMKMMATARRTIPVSMGANIRRYQPREVSRGPACPLACRLARGRGRQALRAVRGRHKFADRHQVPALRDVSERTFQPDRCCHVGQ